MVKSLAPQTYGPEIASLLDPARINDLGPGRPEPAMRERLASLSPARLFGEARIADPDMAAACLAGLWLFWDYLDESHFISQAIPTATGSYWHAIMHRREGDFSNSKYWFRRVAEHPVFVPLANTGRSLAEAASHDVGSAGFRDFIKPLVSQESWDAEQFVDLCRTAQSTAPEFAPLCREIQKQEWQLLFDHCCRHARSG